MYANVGSADKDGDVQGSNSTGNPPNTELWEVEYLVIQDCSATSYLNHSVLQAC